MKAKSFISSLRKVIREEVKSAVREEITNLLTGKVANKKAPSTLKEKVLSDFSTSSKPVKQANYSSNPVLNDILNETANTPTPVEEYPTMGGKPFDSNNLANMFGYGDMQPQATVQNMAPKGVNPEHVPTEVANALTRDYSGLMKAIDKKKGNK